MSRSLITKSHQKSFKKHDDIQWHVLTRHVVDKPNRRGITEMSPTHWISSINQAFIRDILWRQPCWNCLLASHTLMERLKNLIAMTGVGIEPTIEDRSTNPRVWFPQSIRFFNLSMSVCDEQFFVRIYTYHSDDVILQLFENYWLALMKASDRGRTTREEVVQGCW